MTTINARCRACGNPQPIEATSHDTGRVLSEEMRWKWCACGSRDWPEIAYTELTTYPPDDPDRTAQMGA